MDWQRLLCGTRLRREDVRETLGRSPFQQDADLIVFSAAFRRLQDKTQVQPLSEGGRVRTRLTHSIEVASVGRSLGTLAAHRLAPRRGLDAPACEAVAQIVYAACLAHDIGNPPFGHGGEEAIQGWFQRHPERLSGLGVAEAEDLRSFDGNAQGFRILTQLENYRFDGGLRLTCATLGAFLKYAAAADGRDKTRTAHKKPGFFHAEAGYVQELRAALGIESAVRHPLVYLTEAADDICYAIVDLEDGCDAGLLDYREAADVLAEIADASVDPRLDRDEQLHKLRGIAIGRLIDAVAPAFLDAEPLLLAGADVPELLGLTRFGPAVLRAKQLARDRIFGAPSVVERLVVGQRVLSGLFEVFVNVVPALEAVGFDRAAVRGDAQSLLRLLGPKYTPTTSYEAFLGLCDHVTALTDRSAVSLHRRLMGAVD